MKSDGVSTAFFIIMEEIGAVAGHYAPHNQRIQQRKSVHDAFRGSCPVFAADTPNVQLNNNYPIWEFRP